MDTLLNSTNAHDVTEAVDYPPVITSLKHWWIPQVEVPFLLVIILIGFVGNISIIGAIILEKKLKFIGNAFIVNLAVADLIVTSYVLPGVLANVIADKNLFSHVLCNFTALVVSVSCLASMYSLMFVAINRYVAIAHLSKYPDLFTKKKVSLMIGAIWFWSIILSVPPAFGWGDYKYHGKIHVCMYDCNTIYFSYTASFIALSIFVPFLITCLCYIGVFVAFDKNRSRVRTMSNGDRKRTLTTVSTTESGPEIKRTRSKSTKREASERRLVITLFAAVILFTVCWVPYALIILINHDAPAFYKRSCAWLAFTNSAMNSILYGVLNRNFRAGYKKLWRRVFGCCGCGETAMKVLGNSSVATKTTSFNSVSYHRSMKGKSCADVETSVHDTGIQQAGDVTNGNDVVQ